MPLCRSRKIPSSASRAGGGVIACRLVSAVLFTLLMCAGVSAQAPVCSFRRNIGNLSSLDYSTRTKAAQAIRRLPAAEAVPALVDAVKKHSDEFVRYRAFIVLSSFNDRGTAELVRGLIRDAQRSACAKSPTSGSRHIRTRPWCRRC